MKRRILDYRIRIDTILSDNKSSTNWDDVLNEHLVQISFFQHERLIHLIVTVLFAVLTFITVSVFVITGEIVLLFLIAALLILLIPYISHYYLLENEVQKMYKQYDLILEHCSKDKA